MSSFALLVAIAGGCDEDTVVLDGLDAATDDHDDRKKKFDGREVFRYDTFGDEQLWTDTLRMHEASVAARRATPDRRTPMRARRCTHRARRAWIRCTQNAARRASIARPRCEGLPG